MGKMTNELRKVTGYLDDRDAKAFDKFKTEKRIKMDTQAITMLIRLGLKHKDEIVTI